MFKFPVSKSILFPYIPDETHSISFELKVLPVLGSLTIIFPLSSFKTTNGASLSFPPFLTGTNNFSTVVTPLTFIIIPFCDNSLAVAPAFNLRFFPVIFKSVFSAWTTVSISISPVTAISTPLSA